MTTADHQGAAAELALAHRALDVAERACDRAETGHHEAALTAAHTALVLATGWQSHARAVLAEATDHHPEVNT
jgi:hypothetical protein